MVKKDPGEELAKDPVSVDVTGHGSRADWEVVYIKARELARQHGLSVDQFEIEPAKSDERRDAAKTGLDAQEATADSD